MSITLTKRPAVKPAFTDTATGEDVYVEHRAYSSVEFRVPAGTPVTRDTRRAGGYYGGGSADPRATLPNMEIREGAMVIPITDIVDEIVARAEPVDLAENLWQNEEVRERFIECMSERYAEGGIEDKDRRALLAKVGAVVHGQALDKLADAMVGLERDAVRKAAYWQGVRSINDTLRDNNVRVPRSVKNEDGTWGTEHDLLQMRIDPEAENIPGKAWNEAREFWRAEVLRQFPLPVQEPKPAEQGGPDL
jgi:hypothetical protein